ncbi:LysR family transcriptional regulator [Aliivibrio finisterrensis]|uniref:LysR family transcriptional regulator n=1 Tax=Aliivibrio finisterrensis TaxID=511998 RepID=A0A4Q5KH75_9GAMM|nr:MULTISPECIES: LysR family transcriptional regulator [Aliivibrio]MDD9174443.1 LysR family transcriptional regulator [Aliivibrio sp. S3TY1]MDD9191521.1 LysR family transcriptional regulator [Aliivibrio sp. S2TY2]RYU45445.1 LysR family transcriptional regulator [Aliivibrio finisterrensis]
MNLTYLQTFLVVAEESSFTKAAEILDVSKGLVSRHVQRLEETLNTKLFHRTTRSISLTEVGEELYTKAKQIQLLAIEAEMRIKDLTQEVSGDLKVTAPIEFGRALCRHIIPSFRELYPKINLVLDFGPMKKKIESGDFDVAFRAYDELPNDVVAKDLGFIRNVLVSSASYVKNYEQNVIEDIHRCDFILNSQNERWNQLELIKGKQKYNVEVTGTLSSNTYSSILELVLQGVGIASLPYYLVEELLESNELIQVFPEWSVKAHKFSMVYAQRRVTPKKLVTFNQVVTQWLESNHLYTI